MYDLDTDVWEKKFSIKPDINTYHHQEILLVDGDTLLSLGNDSIENQTALGFSSNFGDVTSFEILTDSRPIISNTSLASNNELFFTSIDYRADPNITSVWGYREERIEKLFSVFENNLRLKQVIEGYNGRIYLTGTRKPENSSNDLLELWSYDTQTAQLVRLSNDDWYAIIENHPTPDEGYVFRHLNTPDGLIFVNLKEDSGRELWFTDGTREGTRQLTDINPGTGNSDPENFYHSGDAIYFSADDGIHGSEPWMIRISR